MGEIRVRMRLENEGDLYLHDRRKLSRKKVRKAEIEAVVDTGAVMMLLPQELVEQLGLRRAGKVVVRLANEERVEMEKASGIHLAIGDREMSASCVIGPPGCEPLVGQLVMEELDLIPDPILRTLTPRPESPFLPTLEMKSLLPAGSRPSVSDSSSDSAPLERVQLPPCQPARLVQSDAHSGSGNPESHAKFLEARGACILLAKSSIVKAVRASR